MSLFMILLIVLLILAFGGGTYGYPRYGAVGFSPLAVLVVVLLILVLLGYIHV